MPLKRRSSPRQTTAQIRAPVHNHPIVLHNFPVAEVRTYVRRAAEQITQTQSKKEENLSK